MLDGRVQRDPVLDPGHDRLGVALRREARQQRRLALRHAGRPGDQPELVPKDWTGGGGRQRVVYLLDSISNSVSNLFIRITS